MSNTHDMVDMILEDYVRPTLALHQGNIHIVSIDEEVGEVYLRFSGGCRGCPITSITLYHVIEKALFEHIPWVKKVIDVDSGE